MEVIDFDRLNELQGDRNDPTEGKELNGYTAKPYIKYPATRTALKDMVQQYNRHIMERGTPQMTSKMEYIIATLRYNKILINIEQKKRDKKLKDLLDD